MKKKMISFGIVMLMLLISFSTIPAIAKNGNHPANPGEDDAEENPLGDYSLRGGRQINSYCKDGDHYLWVDYDGIFIDYEPDGQYQIGCRGNYKRLGITFARIKAKIIIGTEVKHQEEGFQIGPIVII